ncbi:MAG: hypothetical protein KAR79_04410 [Simkaniaceae bacterium]|nr:hypothetical protein [Simkaniaceae bacterium]
MSFINYLTNPFKILETPPTVSYRRQEQYQTPEGVKRTAFFIEKGELETLSRALETNIDCGNYKMALARVSQKSLKILSYFIWEASNIGTDSDNHYGEKELHKVIQDPTNTDRITLIQKVINEQIERISN